MRGSHTFTLDLFEIETKQKTKTSISSSSLNITFNNRSGLNVWRAANTQKKLTRNQIDFANQWITQGDNTYAIGAKQLPKNPYGILKTRSQFLSAI